MSSISNVAKNDTSNAIGLLFWLTAVAYSVALTAYLWVDIEALISWSVR